VVASALAITWPTWHLVRLSQCYVNGRILETPLPTRHDLVLFGAVATPHSRHSTADTTLHPEPENILDDLRCLQIETLTYHRASQQLRHARTSQSEVLVTQALAGIWQASSELKAAALRLRTFVLGFEDGGLGSSFESFGELALRTEMSFVLWRLCSFGRVVSAERLCPRARASFGARQILRFFHAADVTSMLQDKFERITERWLPWCARQPTLHDPGHTTEHRRARYQTAIRDSQHDMNALAGDEWVTPWLRAGMASPDWPEAQAAMAHISVALQITMATEPELELTEARDILLAH